MFRKTKDFLEESEMKASWAAGLPAFSVSKRHFPCPMGPQEDMTEQEVRADPDRAQLPRPPLPPPRPPPSLGIRENLGWGWGWGCGLGVGLAGREGAELTPLGINKNLNSFLCFFRVEESRGRKYFTGRRFFF